MVSTRSLIRSITRVTVRSLESIGLGVYRVGSEKRDPVVVDRFILSDFYAPSARRQLYEECLRAAGMEWSDNFPKQCRYDLLVQLLEHVLRRGVAGDVVECGCWKGHSTRMLASTMAKLGGGRRLEVFDSFEGGLSAKAPEDRNERFDLTTAQIREEKQIFSSTEQEVRRALDGFGFVRLHRGWIPDRFQEFGDGKCAFLHVDVDLYQPIKDTLEWFWPLMPSGAVVVLDDHGYCQFPGARRAAQEFFSKHPPAMFLEMPIGGAFAVR
jgi:predicted O-methyltransferase YrrM